MITFDTLTIASEMVHITSIIIKVGIVILFLINMRSSSLSLWRRTLFNMFNPGDQAIDIAHQLIKFPVDVGALVINRSLKLVL